MTSKTTSPPAASPPNSSSAWVRRRRTFWPASPPISASGQLDFADETERTTWHYTPVPRQGLPFTQMDRTQQRLAQALVATGLSRTGFVTASTIMGIETTSDFIEG
ncbi:MAG: DUF3500 domain-containing protein [Caldilineaceae bacterium]